MVTNLFALSAVAALSIVSQPEGMATPPLWPASGIALGLGVCFPRRYLWLLAPAVALMALPVLLWAGRPMSLSLALAAAFAIEMAVGTLLLRGRRDRVPRFATPRDLVLFFGIAFVSASLYGALAFGAFSVFGDHASAVESLQTALLKHAAGIALLTPMYIAPPLRNQQAGVGETVGIAVTALAVTAAVFTVGPAPLEYLPFLPLVWAALRLSTWMLSLLMVGVASISANGSIFGMGPLSFDLWGISTGTVLMQVYQMSMVAVFLTLSIVVGSERDMSARLHESEELFRKSFNSSVAGKLMGVRTTDQWIVERANPSARALLPGLQDGIRRLDTLMGRDAVSQLSSAADSLVGDNARMVVQLDDGRSLNISFAVIGETPDGTQFVVHFHDVTESERLRQLELEEMNRAAEVQRALLPGELPETPGWSFGTSNSPAKQIGGDFYDVRVHQPSIVLSLGDVMGKGMDAGMLAAATRTALRSNDPGMTPSAVVTRAAGILEGDLRRISAFVTLAYVQVDIDSGDFRFADAGHGLHYVVRTRSGRIERLSSDDMPVGLGDRWRELSGRLAPGDMILLVSDGVLDLWGGSLEGLENAIAQCANGTGTGPQEAVDYLCANAGELLDGDDVTAVALRRAG
ncbi:serine/threonine protein phosphatase [Mycolicibacterium tusciae]|uniref:Serine/threonine protein phosphatase n=1 Tax=Mycolicibacterium tusciae TaxID=75922 RepID=A0A1X0JHC8_9MYCO|nr:serine/threonine protein phosphatase [Mycolicibacterium tusciae]